MQYMTKEWYETHQKTSFHLPLKVSKKAEVFSEDYFKKLYKSEEKAWLSLQENDSNETFYEIHALLDKKGLIDFIVYAMDVEYK